MKKILFLMATMGMMLGFISCGDDDEPSREDRVFTVNEAMINHAYNTHTDQALGVTATRCKLTVDTKNQKASLELSYNDGQGEKTLKLDDLKATLKGLAFFELTSASNSSFSGYLDVNQENAMRFYFTTADGIRIISTTPKVFFLKSKNTITYDDETPTTEDESGMYEFDIFPSNNTTTITVSSIVHAQHNKSFVNIVANYVPYTVTPNGFTISGNNIKTTATYISHFDGSAPGPKETTEYPFKTFNATIDLVNDRLEAHYMLGSNATVTATGKTYPESY